MSKLLKAPFSFIGGKRNDLPFIAKTLPDMNNITTIIDLYGGGGTVAIYMAQIYPDKRIIYNDLDSEICESFRLLQAEDTARGLREWLSNQVYTIEEFHRRSKEYKRNGSNNIRERLYLTTMAFRGIHTSSSPNMKKVGGVNVLSVRKINTDLTKYVDVLSRIDILNQDAAEVLDQYKDREDVFIYCDPPYPHTLTETYGISDHSGNEKIKLAICNHDDYKCRIMLHIEYQHDLFYRLERFVRRRYPKRFPLQNPSGGSKNKKANERQLLIICNYETPLVDDPANPLNPSSLETWSDEP